jgi:hypothetical protein
MNNLIPNDSDINRALDYLLSLESVYVLCLIILNILNLCVFYGNKNMLFINGIALIIAYLIISKREDKKELLLSIVHFAIWGVLIESFIIDRTEQSLFYKDPNSPLNVPLWLVPIYMLFCISAIYTYNLFKIIFKK